MPAALHRHRRRRSRGGGDRARARGLTQPAGAVPRVTVKLDAEEREAALTQSFSSVAKYVGRYGWVTVEVIDDDVLTMVLDWVAESCWLKAGVAQRALLEP